MRTRTIVLLVALVLLASCTDGGTVYGNESTPIPDYPRQEGIMREQIEAVPTVPIGGRR